MNLRANTLLILAFLAVACAPGKNPAPAGNQSTVSGSPSDGGRAYKPEITYVTADWKPDQIELTCGAAACPAQIGMVFFAGPAVNGYVQLERCTAFLVADDTIMSNAHCDGSKNGKGYFVTQKINGQKQIRPITGVPYKKYTPHPKDPGLSSGRPDVALFSLDRPVSGMEPLRLASGPQARFNKLILFAVAPGPDANRFTLEKKECTVRRHEMEFPFEIAEAPDMIHSFGCALEAGTSGAPMFAPGSDEVQTVHAGAGDPAKRAERVRKDHQRDLLNYEKHWTAVSTNVRCLDLPSKKPVTCTAVNEEAMGRRFRETQETELEKLRARQIELPNSPVRWRPLRYPLNPQNEQRYEMVYWPTCRTTQEVPRSIPFVIEQVKIQFDEWAMPRAHSLSQITVNATSKAAGNQLAEIKIDWPAAGGDYVNAEVHPRKKMGNSFHIDLPVCPR